MDVAVWWVGTATLLMEIGPLRVLTDPALNETPSSRYSAGYGLHYERTGLPSLPPEGLGRVDLVLLSHDEHGDNLDEAGRALLPTAGAVVTTVSGARRLGGGVRGLAPYASTTVARDGVTLTVTAVPARHGPPGSLPFVGHVVGFVVAWEGQEHGALYVSGDTVWTPALGRIADRFRIGTAVLNVGAARFPILGRVTMGGRGAAKLVRALDPELVIPVHHGGWSHFSEPSARTAEILDQAGLGERVRWLQPGSWTALAP